MLVIRHLEKSYGKTRALTDFSYTFGKGIYALLGPNGSGKSTLVNILTQNLKADRGEVLYNGTAVERLGIRYREKLGFMPQYPGMYPTFTVLDFMLYMAALKGLDKKTARAQIDRILKETELDDCLHKRVGSLSGGMKQRLGLSQAVLGEPEILFLDEPTAGLDPKQRVAVRNFIARIALDKTVVWATHLVSDIEYTAKEVLILKQGVLTESAPADQLTAQIEGRVWRLTASNDAEVAQYQNRFRISNIGRTGERIMLRVLSEGKPCPSAELVAPTLEEYYLTVFGDLL